MLATHPDADQLASGVKTGIDLLLRRLSEPFPAAELRFKPQAVKGNRALAIGYINARCVMDRLDDVLGIDGWKDSYQVLPDGHSVACTILIRVGDTWIDKTDVGGPSEQPDEGDRMKAAFSDAFKRAAVKFGIGRYLYRMPNVWHDYDTTKKQFVGTIPIAAKFLPAGEPAPAKSAATSHVRGSDGSKYKAGSGTQIGGVMRINSADADILFGLIKAANVSIDSFLKHYDIAQLEYLPVTEFAAACERLEKKIPKSAPIA